MPWAGHTRRYAVPEIYAAIKAQQLSLVFVNTRSQAELLFQELWRINEDDLPIALHHGSLDAARRRKVEAAMAAGALNAVVATSTLDLGIDWGDVDLVINVGAPKGASRLIQRVGRANHRLDEPSRALLVPANRFEVLECRAAIDAAEAGEQDTQYYPYRRARRAGAACAGHGLRGSVRARQAAIREVSSASPYAALTRAAVRSHRRFRRRPAATRCKRLRALRPLAPHRRRTAAPGASRASPSNTA